MKKSFKLFAVGACLALASCMGTTGGLFSGIDTASTVGNIITSVLGINKVPETTLMGTWKYSGPGCGFTSENLLAKAGGEVAASKIKSELLPRFQAAGFSSANTYFTFKEDKTFSGKVDGQNLSGTYTYNPTTGQINLKTLLLSLNGYINTTTKGISLLFESKKLLTVMQTIGMASGNTTLATVGELSKNYDGVRIGFDLTR